jgi:transposase
MSLLKNNLVDIPDDAGVHIKSAGAHGEKYVYKYVRYFRNADGNPRSKAKAIGKLDPRSGKMFPNNTYFALYNLDPCLPDLSVWDYGYSYLVLNVCRTLGLFDCLTSAYGAAARDIIILAAYMIREGNAMDGIDDWQQRNYFPGSGRLLTSSAVSRLFAELTARQRDDFFRRWIPTALSGGSVCYDVTSISSYSRQMPTVERGYNRDGDDVCQYNLGMFCDETTKMPLYYNRYNGSLSDRTNLCAVLENAKSVGISRVKLVLDGGFWSTEALTGLYGACQTVTVGMPAYLTEARKLLAAYGAGIDRYANELTGGRRYCLPIRKDLYGIPGRVLLYYDAYNHVAQCAQLSEYVTRLTAELAALTKYPVHKLSRYTPYFILTRHPQDQGFDYRSDHEKIEGLRKRMGYFFIFSTDMHASPEEILQYYRAKDADEKLFAHIKVEMEGGRIRTHTEQTTEGKTFVTFIAAVIRSSLLGKLSPYLSAHSTSLKKVCSHLSNITILSSAGGYRFCKALTKKQKQILAAFDAVDDISASLNRSLSTLIS